MTCWVCQKCLSRHPGEVEIKTIGNFVPRDCSVCGRRAAVGSVNMVHKDVAFRIIAFYRADLALAELEASL